MTHLKKFKAFTLLPIIVSLAACASIMGHPTQTIPIVTTPAAANVSIVDEIGMEVFKGTTPTYATLQKSTGHYFGAKNFTVTISKDGFKTLSIPVTASANGWYIAGNLFFGGLIGYLVVDPMNGNMYTLSPGKISGGLTTDVADNNVTHDGGISVVMIEDVPAELQDKLVRVN